MTSDPISDMLTQIRNALLSKKAEVALPYSNFKHSLARVLQQEGWVKNVSVKEAKTHKILLIQLKYTQNGASAISGIKRISKPGQRIYAKNNAIPSLFDRAGTTIISTSRGLMSDTDARRSKIGGEVVCQIW